MVAIFHNFSSQTTPNTSPEGGLSPPQNTVWVGPSIGSKSEIFRLFDLVLLCSIVLQSIYLPNWLVKPNHP